MKTQTPEQLKILVEVDPPAALKTAPAEASPFTLEPAAVESSPAASPSAAPPLGGLGGRKKEVDRHVQDPRKFPRFKPQPIHSWILRFLGRNRFGTIEQIFTRYPELGTAKSANLCLNRLYHHNFLDRVPHETTPASFPDAYYIRPRGRDLLKDNSSDLFGVESLFPWDALLVEVDKKRGLKVNTLTHEINLTWAAVKIELSLEAMRCYGLAHFRRAGKGIDNFKIKDIDLIDPHTREVILNPDTGKPVEGKIPDLEFCLRTPRDTFPLFILENDDGTENLRTVKEKFFAYHHFWKNGGYLKRYQALIESYGYNWVKPFSEQISPRVLVVATDTGVLQRYRTQEVEEERRNKILFQAMDLGLDKMVMVTTLSQLLSGENFFTSRIWLTGERVEKAGIKPDVDNWLITPRGEREKIEPELHKRLSSVSGWSLIAPL